MQWSWKGLEPSKHPHDATSIEGKTRDSPGEHGATLTYAIQSPEQNGIQVEGTSDQILGIKEEVNGPGQAGSTYSYSDYSNSPEGEWVEFRSDEASRLKRKSAANPEAPDAVGVTVGGSMRPGGGAAKSFTLMVKPSGPDPGAQLYGNIDGGLGNDVSLSLKIDFAYFTNEDSWREDFTKHYRGVEVGAGGLVISRSFDYDKELKSTGRLVETISAGISVGSDQLPMGVVNAQIYHGYSYRISMPWQLDANESATSKPDD